MKITTTGTASEEEVDSPKEQGFLSRLFGISNDDTEATLQSGESEFSSEYETDSYDDETSADEVFDRKLRAKHTKACKYMRVSLYLLVFS